MMRTIARLSICMLLAFAARAQAQAPPPGAPAQQQNPPRIIIRTPVVIVPVTVKDGRGQLVAGLEKDDFRVFSDGVEQQFRFSSDAYPLSAVVVIDNDLGQKAAAQVQKSLTAIAAGFGPADEVALVTYDEFPNTVVDFTFNNDVLFTQLKRLELRSHSNQAIADPSTAGPIGGGQSLPRQGVPGPGQSMPAPNLTLHGTQPYKEKNALDDAIFAATDMLKARGRDRRKIVFVISDGNNAARNVHPFDETLHSLLTADVSLYSISVARPLPIGKLVAQRGLSDLQKYANKTGGDTYYASKQQDLERLYSDVTEQARNQYTLTFSPQGANKSLDYHSIEVRVKRPDLSIDARDGYYQSAIAVGP